jgi:ABC-2 type transport system permease protein
LSAGAGMLRGLWKLTWLEVKIFVREPLGLIGTVAVPVLVFVVLSRVLGPRARSGAPGVPRALSIDLPILVSVLIAASAVLSLVTIIAIYREGGILKRLRATPLRPHTILTAHVIVKLLFTAVTLTAMVLAGRRYYPIGADVPLASFMVAMVICITSIASLGFLIASLVPTARFAQPVGALIIYPMVALSGLFAPIESLPPMLQVVTRALPLTYAVSLLKGIWHGEGWFRHAGDVAILALMFVVFTAVAVKVFRWE